MQDVADKINSKAKQIQQDIFGDNLDGNQKKLCELALVKSLADLYASCHKAEMNKLITMQEPDATAQQNALQSVWTNFDTRAEILSTMAQNMAPTAQKGSVTSSKTPPSPAETQQQSPPSSPPQQTAAPPSSGQAQPGAAEAQQSGNPMAMFSKPKDASGASQEPPPSTPPPTQQPQQTAPPSKDNPMAMFSKPKDEGSTEQNPPAQPPAPPPPPPQAAQPEQPSTPPAPPEENKQEGGNPMAFFKSPPKDEGEE